MSALTMAEALRQAYGGAPDGRVVFPQEFQSFPGTVHGGGTAAFFLDAAGASPGQPLRVRTELARSVPVESPLEVRREAGPGGIRLALRQGARLLAEGVVSVGDAPLELTGIFDGWQTARTSVGRLPGTATCLACGSVNPLGLQLRFDHNDRFVWREFEPRPPYLGPNGQSHPALATIALDEIGWWLGALDQGECGVTNDITITFLSPLRPGPLLVLGDRMAVRRGDDPRGRYSWAEAALLTLAGEPLAVGRVRFAGSRAYTRRLLPAFVADSGEAIYRFFPRSAPNVS